MLQVSTPDDYVICTGVSWSVKDFLNQAFEYAGLVVDDHVEIDPELFRPAEVEYLRGSSSKANAMLGWSPQITFSDLVKDMVDCDIKKFQ
jgi:GDPmannose 4,6-dehydratase